MGGECGCLRKFGLNVLGFLDVWPCAWPLKDFSLEGPLEVFILLCGVTFLVLYLLFLVYFFWSSVMSELGVLGYEALCLSQT